MADEALDRDVAAIRRFNRLYTRRIGLLRQGHLRSPFSLTEVRVMYEIAHRDTPTASEVGHTLGLDAGYLSRILQHFERRGLLERRTSPADGRQSLLQLTRKGRTSFAALDARASREIALLLADRSATTRRRMVDAMGTIERVLDVAPDPAAGYSLRTHRPGDMGWVIHRHGALYCQEHGWDERFEALVAEIAVAFIRHFDAARERCWLAERGDEIMGSVMLVRHTDEVAKLRLLLVEPAARGLGIGGRLVNECVTFARAAGYRTITLWTQSILLPARHIYERAGFRLVGQESHTMFGPLLTAETWDLAL